MRQHEYLPPVVISDEYKLSDPSSPPVSQPTNGDVTSAPPLADITESQCVPLIPDGLEPLHHQLAGHKFGVKANCAVYGILDCKDGTILKPIMLNSKKGEREKYFYDMVNGGTTPNPYFDVNFYDVEMLRKLKDITPVYKGLVTLPEHPDVIYVKMVDVTYEFVRPHIMDVKVGAKCWEPTASQAKIERQRSRCPYLDEICFQVLGAKYHDAQTDKAVVKRNLRRCSPHELLHTGLYDVFLGVDDSYRPQVLNQILTELEGILSWFYEQQQLSFRGSSVLIVFESDTDTLRSRIGSINGSRVVQVKLIDFVHVWQVETRDDNYIEGLNNLINYLRNLLKLFEMPFDSI